MPKRPPFRRCITCNNKSPRWLWKEKECPVCDSAEGYTRSWHGGLSKKEIGELRAEQEKLRREIETPGLTIEKERA